MINDAIIEDAVAALLTGYQPLVNQVGDNISPDEAAQGVREYVVFSIISMRPSNMKQRISGADSFRVQVDAYAPTRKKAASIGILARQAMENRSGQYGGLQVSSVKVENYNGSFNEGSEGHRSSYDYMLRVQN